MEAAKRNILRLKSSELKINEMTAGTKRCHHCGSERHTDKDCRHKETVKDRPFGKNM